MAGSEAAPDLSAGSRPSFELEQVLTLVQLEETLKPALGNPPMCRFTAVHSDGYILMHSRLSSHVDQLVRVFVTSAQVQ